MFTNRRRLLALLGGVGAAALLNKSATAATPFTTFSYPAALPNGTGTTPNSQTSPVREGVFVNVKDFGAKGDNSTDDTAAIQAAINWTNSKLQRGTIYFPPGTYLTSAALQLPTGSNNSYCLRGELGASAIIGTFNGYIFDGLSNPYTVNTGGVVIEKLNITNGYQGQNFNQAASSSWSQSASPVTINVPSLPAAIGANCLVYIIDQRIAPMPVFVGITSSVVAGTSITLPTTAVGSSSFTTLNLAFVQGYLAGASWSQNATTITMSGSPPAGVPTQCLVYDYSIMNFFNGLYTEALGVGTWSGTTFTFAASGPGASQGSHTSSDLLIFAPLAGAIRLSSVDVATVRDCTITGFIGLTSSEDNYNSSGQGQGAQAFNLLVQNNSFSPTTHAAAIGSTAMYLTNNSLSLVNDHSSWWCGTRISGTANSIIEGRCEVCSYGIIFQPDQNSNANSSPNVVAGYSMESNNIAIFQNPGSGSCLITALNILCQNNNGQYGIYLGGGRTTIMSSSIQGNWAQYGLYIPDAGNTAVQNTIISTTVVNNNISNQGWRIPAQAWWGTCIQCNNPALVYTYANLPSGSSSPTPTEGDTYNISDAKTTNCSDSACNWGANVTGGTGALHRQVRWNGSNWTVMGQ